MSSAYRNVTEERRKFGSIESRNTQHSLHVCSNQCLFAAWGICDIDDFSTVGLIAGACCLRAGIRVRASHGLQGVTEWLFIIATPTTIINYNIIGDLGKLNETFPTRFSTCIMYIHLHLLVSYIRVFVLSTEKHSLGDENSKLQRVLGRFLSVDFESELVQCARGFETSTWLRFFSSWHDELIDMGHGLQATKRNGSAACAIFL